MRVGLWLIRLFGIGVLASLVLVGLMIGASGEVLGSEGGQPVFVTFPTITPALPASPTPLPTPTPQPVMSPVIDLDIEGMYLGVYLPEMPGPMESLLEFERLIGRRVALVHWFQAWGSDDRDFKKEVLQSLYEYGVIAVISWEPWERTKDPYLRLHQPEYRLSRIAEGEFDAYIREWARDSKDFGGLVLIRLAHEMNGRWYPWSINRNDNTKEDFVLAWRHIHDIFQEEGVTNVQWVWNPNWNNEWTASKVREAYPGDEYVDWLGITIFNWGINSVRNRWDSLDDVLGWQYNFAIEYAKPIIIAELASDEAGGNKGQWILDTFQSLKTNYPEVRAAVWFNAATARYAGFISWSVNSSPEALEAFREAVKDPYVLGPRRK